MAGSLGLNLRFENAVEELVGEEQFSSLKKTKGFAQASRQFDVVIKRSFRGDPDEDYFVNFPMAGLKDNLDRDLISNSWNMKGSVHCTPSANAVAKTHSDDVEDIFEPLIQDIEGLVKQQVDLVRAKRSEDNHPKADEIRVSNTRLHQLGLTHGDLHLTGHIPCWWFWIEPISSGPLG